ncbi:translation initiation factor IF-2 isoform X1 [Ixodes scapularis]
MIRAHAKENFELACRINESLTLFPLAFRTHTHKLGKAVTGYLVWTGQWTNIGKHSPQEPQMFYPAKIGLKIVKGDMLLVNRSEEKRSEAASPRSQLFQEDRDVRVLA